MALIGISCFIGLAWLLSEDRSKFRWRWIAVGLGLQFLLAFLFLRVPYLQIVFDGLNQVTLAIQNATKVGSSFMFGYLGGGDLPFQETKPGQSFIVAFQVLPIVLVMSALSSILFHWGLLQRAIRGIAWVLKGAFSADPLMALGVSAGVFLGVIETPLLIKPFLSKISRSGLFTIFTNCMASIAGTVLVLYASILQNSVPNATAHLVLASLMSAPASLLYGYIIIPPSPGAGELGQLDLKPRTTSIFEAVIDGTQEGIQMVLGIAGTIIVIFSLVALADSILGLLPLVGTTPLTLQSILGVVYTPLCWLTGIPWEEAQVAGKLMATKTLLNEFVAFMEMAKVSDLSDSSRLIMTYSMAGFANFGSLGILVGSLGLILPQRRNEILSLALKALLSGTLATLTMGAIVGLVA